MFRYVLGLDKNIVIPALSPSAFLVSGQLFGEHILDYRDDLPNEEDNWIGTLLVKGWWMNNRLSPQVIIAHDVGAQATAFVPSVDYLVTDKWKVNLALTVKSGGNEKFDTAPQPFGVWEPLARFTNGPIGVAIHATKLRIVSPATAIAAVASTGEANVVGAFPQSLRASGCKPARTSSPSRARSSRKSRRSRSSATACCRARIATGSAGCWSH